MNKDDARRIGKSYEQAPQGRERPPVPASMQTNPAAAGAPVIWVPVTDPLKWRRLALRMVLVGTLPPGFGICMRSDHDGRIDDDE